MQVKKKIVLIPSAYNHKAMGDIENFIKYYKDPFDVYVITDVEYPGGEELKDGVLYVNKKEKKAKYLVATADYIIDAGTVGGRTKISASQKRISVWHGIPYKKMFSELDKKYIPDAIDYAEGYDLMVSPSEWYTKKFLQQSMLYGGKVLETAVSRTDSLFIDDEQKMQIKNSLGIPEGKKVLLYAPTFRQPGALDLPFSVDKLQTVMGDNWVIVVKLHYLNTLTKAKGVIDATSYASVNNLLAIADLLVTDYSSLLFDYSILRKPALLYQYDRKEYESERSFMFNMEEYVDNKYIVFNEQDLYKQLLSIDLVEANLEKVRTGFYPHQKHNSTEELVKQLSLDSTNRKMKEVFFLVNELNQIGGVHTFITNLAREFKTKYDAKVFVIGTKEFDRNKDKLFLFDKDNLFDIKLSVENNKKAVRNILKSTDGYIISCQLGAHKSVQKYLKDKKAVLMFHGDAQDVVDRNIYRGHLDEYNDGIAQNYKRLIFLTKGNSEVIKDHLKDEVRAKTIHIENGMDFSDRKSLYKESGDFVLVSRLDPDKNPMEAIDIFSDSNLHPERRLHIYGDGSLRQEMERKVKENNLSDRVFFHGYVENKEEIYKDKQGLISISLTEGLPLTVLEAVKYGIPVYSYDSFTSCGDLVTEKTGIRVKAGDKKAFVSALNNTFDYSGFDGDELVSTFSNDNVTQKWEELFEELDKEVNDSRSKKSQNSKNKNKKNKINVSSIKRAIRNSFLFENNELYPEIAVKIKEMRNSDKAIKKPLVSIIMPFYNNNETIYRAVRSVKNNGYDNYEIILVNDGSEEDPRPLLKRFKKIQYYYKENGGLSSTRNYAMDKARGKYVIFLDSDDIIYPGGLNKMVMYAEKHKLDMVSGLTVRQYVNQKEIEYWYKGIYKKTCINRKIDRYKIIKDTIATGKLYNLDMLKTNDIRFKDGLYEDVLFTGQLYALLDKIGIVKNVSQKWMIYGTGTSITTRHSIKNIRARLDNVDTIYRLQSDVMKAYYTENYINHHMLACIYGYNNLLESEKKEVFELLRQGITKRADYIVDKLILRPSVKELYKSLLDNDYDRFSVICEGFSAWYYDFHNDM